jgi:hypothetical protein
LLPPGILGSQTALIAVSFASHETIAIPSSDLDPEVKPMVADRVDGKRLTAYVPYYFVAKSREKNTAPIKDVKLIAVHPQG